MKESSVQFAPSKFTLANALTAAGARDEKQPEAAEKSKETNARGADTGSRSATQEIKSGGAVGLTRAEQWRGSRDERRARELQISYLERL